MGRVDEWCAVPFFVVAGRRVRAVGEVGEAIFRSNTAPVTPEKTLRCFAQEAEVFVLDEPADNRVFAKTDRLGSVAAGQVDFPVIQPVVSQPSAKLDPKQPPFGGHSPPCRRCHDCLWYRHKRSLALSLTFAHALATFCRALAQAMLRERTHERTSGDGAIGVTKLVRGQSPNRSRNL
jgi:hypothetical protein